MSHDASGGQQLVRTHVGADDLESGLELEIDVIMNLNLKFDIDLEFDLTLGFIPDLESDLDPFLHSKVLRVPSLVLKPSIFCTICSSFKHLTGLESFLQIGQFSNFGIQFLQIT